MYLSKLQKAIMDKKQLLLKKKKELNEKQKINNLLVDVQNDYEKYYHYIKKEKTEQYNSLMLLNEYLNDMIHTEKTMNKKLHSIKVDQKHIVNEIHKVKTELDQLIE